MGNHKNKDSVMITFWVKEDIKKRFKDACDNQDKDMTKVLRRTVETFIKEYEIKLKEEE